MYLELARLIYAGFLGIYGFAAVIFLICFLHLKIKQSDSFLALAFLNFLYILLTIFFIEDIPTKIKAFYLFPFAGVLGFLSFYTYFSILMERFDVKGVVPKLVKTNSIALAGVMGLIVFFSSIDVIRGLFLTEALSPSQNLYLASTMGCYQLTLLGQMIMGYGSFWVLTGNLYALVHLSRKKLKGYHRLMLFGVVTSLLASLNDNLMGIGAAKYLFPAAFLGYFFETIYFLLVCFSSYYGKNKTMRARLERNLRLKENEKLRDSPARVLRSVPAEKVMLLELLNYIVLILKDRKSDVEVEAELNMTESFYLKVDKAELIILFYSLLEKAFENISENPGKKGVVVVDCERLEHALIKIKNDGPAWKFRQDAETRGKYKVEKNLLLKNQGDLSFKKEGRLNVLEMRFRT